MESVEVVKGKTILVTGGAGFIGSHLVKELIKRKAKVIVVDIVIHPQSFFLSEKLKQEVIYKNIDIRNKEKVSRFFIKTKPDYVFHLAAEPIVGVSYKNPYDTFMTNVIGTVNILEAVRKVKNTKAIIVASSDKAYGKTEKPYAEDSPLHGDHPYDVSKSCTDLIAQTYYRTYKLPVIITRFGNVYGEGDIHFERIIPGICKSVIQNQRLDIRSDGTYIRDYIYVKDVAYAYLFLLEKHKGIIGEAFNFSSNDTFSVLKLINKLESVMNTRIPYKILNNAKNEIPYQHLEDSKIKKLGWKNRYAMEQTIPDILSWYRKVLV